MSRRWRPAWNPNSYKFTVHLEAGKPTPIRINWEPDGDVSYIGLRVAPLETPEQESRLTFWSEFEPQADYYFIAGENYLTGSPLCLRTRFLPAKECLPTNNNSL